MAKAPRKWSIDEDNRLSVAVEFITSNSLKPNQETDGISWLDVAELVGTRNNGKPSSYSAITNLSMDGMWSYFFALIFYLKSVQCLQRWQKVLKPGLKKGNFRFIYILDAHLL